MAGVGVVLNDAELQRLIAQTRGKGPVRIVADGVTYGIYQELGTSKMAAQPFMVPAVEAVRPGFNQAFRGVVTNRQATIVVEKTARDVERIAKDRAPYDTGALSGSIHVEPV